jgi:hypothetical protein
MQFSRPGFLYTHRYPRFKFIIQRVSKVPQPGWAKARIGERSLGNFDAFWLAQSLRNVPEVYALCFEARLIEQGRVPFNYWVVQI